MFGRIRSIHIILQMSFVKFNTFFIPFFKETFPLFHFHIKFENVESDSVSKQKVFLFKFLNIHKAFRSYSDLFRKLYSLFILRIL